MERLFTTQEVLESWDKSCKVHDDVDQEAKDIVRKALELKIAEEQGLLLRLPCEPEDKLYWISDEDEDFDYEPIEEVEVAEFSYNGYSLQIWFADTHDKEYPILPSVAIGNELFLTREEEQKLSEMRGE